MAGIHFEIDGTNEGLIRKLRESRQAILDSGRTAEQQGNKINQSFEGATKGASGLNSMLLKIGGTAALTKLVSDVIRVRGEFQQLDVAFTTLLQSKEKANALMAQMVETAAKTPFNLTELATGARQLVAYGFASEEVNGTLVRLGNVASGLGLPLERLTYLYGTTMTQGRLYARDLMQFTTSGIPMLQGLADMYGVSTAKVNEMVTAGKIGFPEVQKVIENLTNEGGKFFNLMEEQSKTITGKISNLGDAMDTMFNSIGQANEGVINDSIDGLKYLVENYEQVGRILIGLVATYGTYKAAVIITNFVLKEQAAMNAILTASNGALSSSTVLQIHLSSKLEKAHKLLNATMLSNPYVLIATLVVGAAAAMWALHDSTSAAEKAQKRFNEVAEAQKRQLEQLKSKTEELTGVIRSETSTQYDKEKALDSLQKMMPTIFKNMDIEKLKLMDILSLNKQIAGEINRRERIGAKTNLVISQKKYDDAKNEYDNVHVVTRKGKLGDLEESSKQERHKGLYDKMKAAEDELKLAQKQVDNILNIQKKAEESLKPKELKIVSLQSNIDTLKAEIAEMQLLVDKEKKESGGWSPNSVILDAKKGQLSTRQKEMGALAGGNAGVSKENKTLKQLLLDIDASKSKIKELQEQANKGLISSDKIKEEQDALAKLTSDYKNRTGKEYGSTKQSTQAANTAESLREQQEKYKLLLDKQSLDRIRAEEDLQNQVDQSRIDAMTDGFDKQQEQRDLNNKKEIQSLERQKDDYIRAIIQAEKDKFDAQEDVKAQQKKGYVKQTFDTSTVSVDASVFDGIINNTSKKQLNDKVREQEDAWDEYIIKYGAFTQKKEAIDRKYKKLIDEAPDAGIAATLQKEWEEATANLDLSKLKQDMNWEMIFGDLSKVTKDQLKNIKKQLSEFKKSPEFQNATPEQIQVIEGAINSINNAMVDKGGFFGGMAKSVNELKIATEELKKAEEELAKANKSGTDAQKEEAQKKVNKAKNNQQNAETNVTKSGDKTIQHLTSVGDAIAQLGSSAEMSLSSFGNATGGIVDAFTEAGSKIGGLVGAIFSILDGIQQQGFDKFVGNILESVAGAALNVATFGLVKIGADYSHYNEMKEEYDELNEIWDELIDKKMEYIDISYGIEASKVGKEAEAIQQKAIDGYRTLGLERLNSGASAGSHSIGVRINNGMSSEGWEQAKTALGTTFDDLAIGDGRMTGMFDLTAKQLEKLKEEAPLFWAKLDDDVKGYLNKIIEGEDKIDEIQEKVKEQLTQTSFDNVFDSFMDTLMDMDSAAQDFAGDFEEYMKRAVLMNVMGPKLQKQLETWYENFSKDMDKKREKGKFLRPGKVLEEAGILTDEELKNRKEEWDKIVQDGIAERDALFAAMGFDSDPSREASKKGIATASQDSVDENNGRLTVIQGHTYSINETLKEIASFGRVIMSDCAHLPRLEDIGNNLRALTASQDIAIGHLSNIEKNTARLEAIENTMVSMNRGIQDMNTKGLTFRR